MKNLLLASVGLLALGVASASAADLPRAMPAKAPVYVAPPLYNWTGFYVGINGGAGFGTADFSGPFSTSFNTSGGLIGGTLGYNWQMNQLVFGLEGDVDWANIRGSGSCAGTNCSVKHDWLATLRGRLGFTPWDRGLLYVTGGAAWGNVNADIAGVGSSNETKTGWTIGGGLEAAIAGPWTGKIEYLYVDLGDGGAIAGTTPSTQTHIVRAGLNYRF